MIAQFIFQISLIYCDRIVYVTQKYDIFGAAEYSTKVQLVDQHVTLNQECIIDRARNRDVYVYQTILYLVSCIM